jgi:hypothetical protein
VIEINQPGAETGGDAALMVGAGAIASAAPPQTVGVRKRLIRT